MDLTSFLIKFFNVICLFWPCLIVGILFVINFLKPVIVWKTCKLSRF